LIPAGPLVAWSIHLEYAICVHFIDTPARRAEVVPPENRRHDTARTYATLRVGCEASWRAARRHIESRIVTIHCRAWGMRTGPVPTSPRCRQVAATSGRQVPYGIL
jgi:hypothetical protein